MAHRSGFTRPLLGHMLTEAGFLKVAIIRRARPYYDLWAVATRWDASAEELCALAGQYFPPAPAHAR